MIRKGVYRLWGVALFSSLLILIFIGLGLKLTPADAAIGGYTFEVDTTSDLPDFQLVDHLCSTQQGHCSLRAAIQQANYEAGPDTIILPIGTYVLTRTGTAEDNAATGDLDIYDSLTILGAGNSITRVDANSIDRVFHIFGSERGGVTVTLQSMTIENGLLPDNAGFYDRDGGGIYFSNYDSEWLPGSLTLQNVNVRTNQASNGNSGSSNTESGGKGGGIYSLGDLILNYSQVEFNLAGNGAAGSSYNGSGGDGGGIYAQGSLILNHSTVEYNWAGRGGPEVAGSWAAGTGGDGGGIVFDWYDGDVTITDSLIRYNHAGSGGSSTAATGGSGGHGGGFWGRFHILTMTSSQVNYNNAGQSGSGLNESTSGWPKGGQGGGIWVQNYFFRPTSGVVDLTNVYFIGNQAGNGSGLGAWGGDGGAIYYYYDGDYLGSLDITDCLFTNNHAGDGADGDERGGYGGAGGALYLNKVPVTINQSRFTGNQGGDGGSATSYGGYGGGGGAIRNYYHSSWGGSTLTITNSTLNSNSAGDGGNGATPGIGGTGGGIHSARSWVPTINRSTINNNHAGAGGTGGTRLFSGDGGGVYAYEALTMNSSTISGNWTLDGSDTASGRGGGVYGGGTILNSTITNNTTSIHSPNAVAGPSMGRSIIAGNLPSDCTWINSIGYNLVGTSCGGTVGTDIIGIDPKLGPLQDNGGPTKTHALQSGSPAIEAGDPSSCPSVDQRGYNRPVDNDGDGTAVCDIGSVEAQFVESTTVYGLIETIATSFGATGVTITRTLGTTDPMTVTVTLNNESPGGGTPDPGEMGSWWNISAYVNTGLGLDLGFCYTDDQLGVLVESALQVYSNDGNGWTNQGGSVDESNNCVYVEGITTLSEWTLATSTPVSDKRIYLPLILK